MLQYFTINQPLEKKSGNNFIRWIISGLLHTTINCDMKQKKPGLFIASPELRNRVSLFVVMTLVLQMRSPFRLRNRVSFSVPQLTVIFIKETRLFRGENAIASGTLRDRPYFALVNIIMVAHVH
jgi:hypothetical protein